MIHTFTMGWHMFRGQAKVAATRTILIMGLVLVLAVTLPRLATATATHKAIRCTHELEQLCLAIEMYGDAHRELPPEGTGLDLLREEEFALPGTDLLDPWGQRFVYKNPGVHNVGSYDLYSLGKDGRTISGGADADDINNWDKEDSWLYEAYGFIREEEARRIYFSIACGALLLWVGLVVVVVKRGRSGARCPRFLDAAVAVATGPAHVAVCVCLTGWAGWSTWLMAFPVLLVAISSAAAPRSFVPVLSTAAASASEFVILILAGWPFFPSWIERVLDGRSRYLLVPVVMVCFGRIAARMSRRLGWSPPRITKDPEREQRH